MDYKKKQIKIKLSFSYSNYCFTTHLSLANRATVLRNNYQNSFGFSFRVMRVRPGKAKGKRLWGQILPSLFCPRDYWEGKNGSRRVIPAHVCLSFPKFVGEIRERYQVNGGNVKSTLGLLLIKRSSFLALLLLCGKHHATWLR